MSQTNSHLAYASEEDAFAAAAASPRGARFLQPDYKSAQAVRARLNYARRVLRERSTEVYGPGDPGYGICEYDGFAVRIRRLGDDFYIYIEPHNPLVAEPIPNEPVPQVAKPPEPPLIEAPRSQLEFRRRI